MKGRQERRSEKRTKLIYERIELSRQMGRG
jgi:hypothetical protein